MPRDEPYLERPCPYLERPSPQKASGCAPEHMPQWSSCCLRRCRAAPSWAPLHWSNGSRRWRRRRRWRPRPRGSRADRPRAPRWAPRRKRRTRRPTRRQRPMSCLKRKHPSTATRPEGARSPFGTSPGLPFRASLRPPGTARPRPMVGLNCELASGHLMRGAIRQAISGHQEAIQRPSRGHPEVIQRSSRRHQEVIKRPSRGHQEAIKRSSRSHQEVIKRPSRSHQEAIKRPSRGHQGTIKRPSRRGNQRQSGALTFRRRLGMDGRCLRQRRRRVDLHTHHHLTKVGAFGHDAPSRSVSWVAHLMRDAIKMPSECHQHAISMPSACHKHAITTPHRVRLVGLRTKRCCCAPFSSAGSPLAFAGLSATLSPLN